MECATLRHNVRSIAREASAAPAASFKLGDRKLAHQAFVPLVEPLPSRVLFRFLLRIFGYAGALWAKTEKPVGFAMWLC
jgi:hypothetical protein